MAIKLSIPVRNAILDSFEAAVGTAAILKLRSGVAPADCAAADSGTVIATLNLPTDWMAPAVNGVMNLQGNWQDAAADAGGTVAHFRIYASDGVTCHLQGVVTAVGGGGDMTLDNVAVNAGQQITVTSFTLTAPNA